MSGNISEGQKEALSRMMLEGIKKKDAGIVLGCIRRGGDVDRPVLLHSNSIEIPLLHWVAQIFDEAVAEVILQHGSSVDVRDKYGRTALFSAIENRNVSAVEFLMRHGADPLAQSNNGVVALDAAREISEEYAPHQRAQILEAMLADYSAETPSEKDDFNSAATKQNTPSVPIQLSPKTKNPGGGLNL